MSFGISGCCMHPFIQEETDNIVLQINRHAPYVTGQRTKIHISQAKYVVYADIEKETIPGGPMEEDGEIEAMSRYLLELEGLRKSALVLMRKASGLAQSRKDMGGMRLEQPMVTSARSSDRAAMASATARA